MLALSGGRLVESATAEAAPLWPVLFATEEWGKRVFRERLRVRFDKGGLLRFISHRDLMRLFERALRRAGLPLAMTQGYNPHPRLSFPLALGTGMVGENEVMEFELSEWLPPNRVREALAAQLPPGIRVRELEAVSPRAKAAVTTIRYRVHFLEPPPVTEDEVAAVLVRDSIPVRRRRKGEEKTVDIRPFLRRLSLRGADLLMECAVCQGSTTRPEEVLEVLGVEVKGWLARMELARTETVLEEVDSGGRRAAPQPGRRGPAARR